MNAKNSLSDAINSATVTLQKDALAHALKASVLAKAWIPLLRACVAKGVKEKDGEFCAIGESGKNFGCYKTKEKAEARLEQVKEFSKKALDSIEPLVKKLEDGMGQEFPAPAAELDVDLAAAELLRAATTASVSSISKSAQESFSTVRELAAEYSALAKGGKPWEKNPKDEDEDEDGAKKPKGKDKKPRKRKLKGLPAESAEGGIHIHSLERNNSTTKADGPHEHIFVLEQNIEVTWPDGYVDTIGPGTMLFTDVGGSHVHALADSMAERSEVDGEHFHSLNMPDGKPVETTEDGPHSHELQVGTTSFDGVHTHVLELENQTLTSLTPAQFWSFMGMPAQDHLPPVPAAYLFAWLAPETRAALMAMGSVAALKSKDDDDNRTEAVKSEFRRGTVGSIKLPDPRFVMKRLKLQKSAYLLSTMTRKSRLDEPQALVNELTPMKFEASFMWGVVSHGEAQVYKTWGEVPEDVREGIDPHTAKTFESGDSQVCVHPLALVKSFDEPVKLKTAPGGRRFAAKIDLEADIVDVVKCQECTAPFENPNDGFALCSDCRRSDTKVAKAARVGRDVRIVKTAEVADERLLFGVVLVPDEADAQDDIYDASEVQKAAFGYMEVFGGKMKLMHKGETLDDGLIVLESYVSKSEETFGDDTYPAGTWFMTTRVKDDGIWESVKKGEFTGFSMGGSAIREALA